MQNIARDITVVIASLGAPWVLDTINSLNRGTLRPARIIVCVPRDCELDLSDSENAELLHVEGKGQVLQRSEGFRLSETAYTLQLDDDILVDERCLENLRKCMDRGMNIAVAPSLLNRDTGISLYHLAPGSFWLRLYYWLINGKRGFAEGRVTAAGTGFGIDAESREKKGCVETEWLPGGCVIHRTENLVTENYFPFTGKAYAEDLLHSLYLRKKGITLYICLEAKAYVEPYPGAGKMKLVDFLSYIRGEHQARKFYLQEAGKPLIRLYYYYICQMAGFLVARIKQAILRENSTV